MASRVQTEGSRSADTSSCPVTISARVCHSRASPCHCRPWSAGASATFPTCPRALAPGAWAILEIGTLRTAHLRDSLRRCKLCSGGSRCRFTIVVFSHESSKKQIFDLPTAKDFLTPNSTVREVCAQTYRGQGLPAGRRRDGWRDIACTLQCTRAWWEPRSSSQSTEHL